MKRTTTLAIATAVALAGLAGCSTAIEGNVHPTSDPRDQNWIFSNLLDQAGFSKSLVVRDYDRFVEVGRSMCDNGPVIPYFQEVGWPTSTERTTIFIEAARLAYCPDQG